MKPIRAWAVVTRDGDLFEHDLHHTLSIFNEKEIAEKYCWTCERVIRVRIEEVKDGK